MATKGHQRTESIEYELLVVKLFEQKQENFLLGDTFIIPVIYKKQHCWVAV